MAVRYGKAPPERRYLCRQLRRRERPATAFTRRLRLSLAVVLSCLDNPLTSRPPRCIMAVQLLCNPEQASARQASGLLLSQEDAMRQYPVTSCSVNHQPLKRLACNCH